MWYGVVTNTGVDLLEQWSSGSQILSIDKATIGTGSVQQSDLVNSTIVRGEVGEVSIVSSQPVTSGTQYRVQVGAASDNEYTAHQIGIWAHVGTTSTTPVLLCIYQDDTGLVIPTNVQSPGFSFTLYATVAMNNTGSMSVNYDTGAVVTQADLTAAVTAINTQITSLNSSITTLTNNLDGRKFYNSVTDLNLTSGSATIANVWSAMAVNSDGMFNGSDFAAAQLPNSNQVGTVYIRKLVGSRGEILFVSKAQDRAGKNQICWMGLSSSNAPSGTWRDVAALTAADVGALSLSGGTLTGILFQKNNGADLDNPTSTSLDLLRFQDKNGTNYGYLSQGLSSEGVISANLGVYRRANNNLVYNTLSLRLAEDGTRSIALSEAAPWRSALGIGDAQANVYQLTSGGNKAIITMSGNGCAFMIKRYSTNSATDAGAFCLADYWGAGITVLGNLPSGMVIRKESGSTKTITIQNNTNLSQMITVIGGTIAEGTDTTAITGTTLLPYGPAIPVPISQGGTGAATAAAARSNLGLSTAVMPLTYPSGVSHQAGTSALVCGHMVHINECVHLTANKASGDVILSIPYTQARWAYSHVQDATGYICPCHLTEGNVILDGAITASAHPYPIVIVESYITD